MKFGSAHLVRSANAAKILKVPRQNNNATADADAAPPDPRLMSPTEQKRQRLLDDSTPNTYVNCDYILGSVAEVERLWSLARNVLPYNRGRTQPLRVEALLFLKVNDRFWNQVTVEEALRQVQDDQET